MQLNLQEGWSFLLSIFAAGGGGAFIAYLGLKKLAEKWLDGKFAERLANLRHEQSKEIDGIRKQVQWEFSRISKIHDKEFEVLPQAWLLLHEANGKTGNLVGRLKQIPDFFSMPDTILQQFVANCRLPEHTKQEILTASRSDRANIYSNALSWIELSEAEDGQRVLNNYLIEHRIFMPTELADEFRAASVDLAGANSDYRLHKQYSTPELFTKSADRFNAVQTQLNKIEKMIQERLHYNQA